MPSAFGQSTAKDIMSRDVKCLTPDTTLRAAADALARARISGAPVVDRQGRCVGVFSTADLARWINLEGRSGWFEGITGTEGSADVFDVEVLPNEEIRLYMTADPVTASADTTVAQLAQMMVDGGIHRVVITDTAQRPVGLVSSTDILALVAKQEQSVA
jgi:CBS domain-containing membrane protein